MQISDDNVIRDLEGIHEVHVVGIGGAGMSAIARVLHGRGFKVHGSDRRTSPLTQALHHEGIRVTVGHHAGNLGEADLVLASSAVPDDNAELAAARARAIQVARRPAFLPALTAGYDVVAIAGAHGKTTVTGMVTLALLEAGLDPTYIVGGVVQNLGTNAAAGRGNVFVIEADEYRNTFLALKPKVAVVTNIAFDHPDCFPSLRFVRFAFGMFVDNIVEGGLLVACADDEVGHAVAASHHANGRRVLLYGLTPAAGVNWQASGIHLNEFGGFTFTVERRGQTLCDVKLRVPGDFNVANALATFGVTAELGVSWETTRSALETFEGTARRFEVLGEVAHVTVIDDYAHHPAQISGVLRAARDRYGDRRLIAVWEPHTFSRIRALRDDFMTAFVDADEVVIMPIYAAREEDDGTLSASNLVQDLRHPSVRSAATLDETVALLAAMSQPGDVILLMGAGNEYLVGRRLLDALV